MHVTSVTPAGDEIEMCCGKEEHHNLAMARDLQHVMMILILLITMMMLVTSFKLSAFPSSSSRLASFGRSLQMEAGDFYSLREKVLHSHTYSYTHAQNDRNALSYTSE